MSDTRDLGPGQIYGYQLPHAGQDGPVFTLRTLEPATDDRLALARRNLLELRDADLERLGPRRFRERESGEEWFIPRGFTSLYDPTSAAAFVIRDNLIVPLQRLGQEPQGETQSIGEMRGQRV